VGSFPITDSEGNIIAQGYGTSDVTAIYRGGVKSKSKETLIVGSYSEPAINEAGESGTLTTTKRYDAPTSSGGVSSRSASDVRVSPSLYNKYLKDTGSPYRRAEGSDEAYLVSGRERAKEEAQEYVSQSLPFDRFKESNPPYIAEVNRLSAQEKVFERYEKGTIVEGLNIGGDWLREKGVNILKLRDSADFRQKTPASFVANTGSIIGGNVVGGAGSFLKQPSQFGRDALISTGWGLSKQDKALFTPAERLGAGINTGVRAVTLGLGAYSGLKAPVGLTKFDIGLIGAGIVGAGAMGLDYLSTPKGRARSLKGFDIIGNIGGLVSLGYAGKSIGMEYNPYLKLNPITTRATTRATGYKKGFSYDKYGLIKIDGKITGISKLQTSNLYEPTLVTTTRGRGVGASQFSAVKLGNGGKTYFSSSYKSVVGNNYYGRGTITDTGKVSISYFKGDKLIGKSSFKNDYSIYLTEKVFSSTRARSLKAKPEIAYKVYKGIGIRNVVSKDFSGFVKSDALNFVSVRTKGGGAFNKAMNTNFQYANDYPYLTGQGNPASTIYNIKTGRVSSPEFIITKGKAGYSVSKPSYAIVTEYTGVTRNVFLSKKGSYSGSLNFPFKISLVNRNVGVTLRNVKINNIEYFGNLIPKSKAFPLLAPTLKLNSSYNHSNRFASFSLGSELYSGSKERVVGATSFKPDTRLTLFSGLKSDTSSVFTGITPTISTPTPINPITPIINPPVVNPPITPPVYGFPRGLGFGGGGKERKDVAGLFNPKYVASVGAGLFGIRGSKPSKAIIESGLTIRPISRG
jgi:hypothetical protein